jgi:hypothetical protein
MSSTCRTTGRRSTATTTTSVDAGDMLHIDHSVTGSGTRPIPSGSNTEPAPIAPIPIKRFCILLRRRM